MNGGRVAISVPGVGQIAKCYQQPARGDNRGMTEKEMMANARLMAAAPLLLEVCKNVISGWATPREARKALKAATLVGKEK
jgi:hypothetical protein